MKLIEWDIVNVRDILYIGIVSVFCITVYHNFRVKKIAKTAE